METDDLITPSDAARRLGLRRASVYHLADNKRHHLPRVLIAGRTFFRAADVAALIAAGPRRAGRPRRPGGDADATT